jgi:hypothetical protein
MGLNFVIYITYFLYVVINQWTFRLLPYLSEGEWIVFSINDKLNFYIYNNKIGS